MPLRDPVVVKNCPNQSCVHRAYGVQCGGTGTDGRIVNASTMGKRLRSAVTVIRARMRAFKDKSHKMVVIFNLVKPGRNYPCMIVRTHVDERMSISCLGRTALRKIRALKHIVNAHGYPVSWSDLHEAQTEIWLTGRSQSRICCNEDFGLTNVTHQDRMTTL